MSESVYLVRRARVDDAQEVFSLVKDFPPEAIPDRQVFQATFAALALHLRDNLENLQPTEWLAAC